MRRLCVALGVVAACTGGGGTPDGGGGTPDGASGTPDAAGPDAAPPCNPDERVLSGNYTIENALDVDALAGYTRVTGDLTINTAGLASIVLPDLCAIDGWVYMNTGDVDTLSMPSLETIGGRLELVGLVDAAFPRLTSIGLDLEVRYARLTNLDGLSALRSLGRDLSFVGNFQSIDVDGLAGLTEIPGVLHAQDGMPILGTGLTHVTTVGALEVYAPWTDLSPLAGLQTVTGRVVLATPGPFSTAGAPDLATIGANLETVGPGQAAITFPHLTSIGGQLVFSADTLSLLDLPELTTLPDLQLLGQNGLTAMNLPAATTTEGVHVDSAAALVTVDLSGLTSATQGVALNNVDSLLSVDLSSLDSGGFGIGSAPMLTTVQAPLLRTGAVAITSCDTLAALSLPSYVDSPSIWIDGNASLATLDVPLLDTVTGVFHVRDNPTLSQCDVDAILAGLSAPPATIDVSGNLACP